MDKSILEKRLDRSNRKVEMLEKLIEDKTREVYLKNEKLHDTNQYLSTIYDAMPGAMLIIKPDGLVEQSNYATQKLLSQSKEDLEDKHCNDICHALFELVSSQSMLDNNYQHEHEWIDAKGEAIPVLVSASRLSDIQNQLFSYIFIATDLRERRQIELELRHAQKLESIGQLAAGIAHEINTPMQYIGDNIHFIQESITDVFSLLIKYQFAISECHISEKTKIDLETTEDEIDLEYLQKRIPSAIDRTSQGISRVSEIVSAMKAFSHPSEEKVAADINEAIKTTLIIAKAEYKYSAEVICNYGEIPEVICNSGDIKQVLLNLIVNAAHAISERLELSKDSTIKKKLGTIKIDTYLGKEEVVIEIKDNGNGIPNKIHDRIFDPFFTTKQIGKGTGQGLSLAYVVVVDKHQGKLYFKTRENIGTTFYIHLPIASGKS